jgi:hypothetical protein
MNILLIISVLVGLLAVVALIVLGIILNNCTFFCAFPRTSAYGDPNKLRYIHLKGFFFVISNDIWGKDVVYSNEASNMMFKYNLKSTMNPKEILNSNQPLNIEMLDVVSGKILSYSVPHGNKAQAIRFFTQYRELMNRIHAHQNSNIK